MMTKPMKYGYTCYVMFLLSILLHNYELKVSGKLSTRIVYEGRPVRLRCNCISDTMTWKYFNNSHHTQGKYIYRDAQVIDDFRWRLIFDNNGNKPVSFLKTRNVSITDTGYYKCYCNGNKLVSETLLQVALNGYPHCTVLSRSDNSTVEYGRSGQKVILACDSGFDSNFPPMRWMRQKRKLPAPFGNTKVALRTVKLTKSVEDVAYTCILGNSNGVSAPSCSVMPFRYRPRIKINPSVTIQNVGDNVTFKCFASLENRLALSDMVYAWNETILDQFSGRFVLDYENRSLQLLNLKDSDDSTILHCRVTIRSTDAQDTATALLKVNKTTGTPQLGSQKSTPNYPTSVIQTHSTLVTFDNSPVDVTAVTLESDFYSYLWISLTSVCLTTVIVFLGVLCVFTLNKRRMINRNETTRRILSVHYEEIKPKAAVKSNDQLVFGIVEPVKVNSSDFKEEHELNNVAFYSADITDSPEHPLHLGEQHGYTSANGPVERNEFIKPDNLYTQADETKFTETPLSLREPNRGSATGGQRTIDTFPVYATVNKKKN